MPLVIPEIPEAWSKIASLEALDHLVSSYVLAALLRLRGEEYGVLPYLAKDGFIRAKLDIGRGQGAADVAVRPSRESNERIEWSCTCADRAWRDHLCTHATRLLVALAAHPPLLSAVLTGGDVAARLAELPAVFARITEDREAMRDAAEWLAPRSACALEFAVEIEIETYEMRGAEPMVMLRARRVGERAVLGPRDLFDTPISDADSRIIDLTSPPRSTRKVFLSRAPLASLLLRELSARAFVGSGAFRGRVTFAKAAVRPRVVEGRFDATLVRAHRYGGQEAASSSRKGRSESSVDALACEWVREDGGPSMMGSSVALVSGPFPYVWHKPSETFYAVAPDVDMGVARRLQRRPIVALPSSARGSIGRLVHASLRGRGVELPARESLGLPPLETPAIVLRLEGTALAITGRLEAVYAARTITLPAPAMSEDIARDVETEAAAVAAVTDSGLRVDAGPEAGGVSAFAEEAIDFWQHGILRLRANEAPRVEVLLTETLARVKVGPSVRAKVRVRLVEGWLDTNVDFNVEELSVELEAVRGALAAGARWVSLSDGTLARIADDVASLATEAADVLGTKGARRLPAHQLGRVARWVDEHAGAVDESVSAFRSRLRALAVSGEPRLPSRLEATLRPYQQHGIAWLQFVEELGAGAVLADDMGLGKTLMTLAFLARQKEDRGPGPSLVVCPTSVVTGWVRESARFTPDLRVLLFHGAGRDAAAIAEADLVVTTYALLRAEIETLESVSFRTIIVDEAQNIKNADAATTLAAKRLKATMRIALSGTPVENRLRELWSIADFVNPGMLGSARSFDTAYERPIASQPDGPGATQLRALLRPFLLRRTKEQVLVDLPPKIEIERACTLSPAQKRLYDALAVTLRESVEQKIAEVGIARAGINVLTALLRLRQMACDPRLVDPRTRVPSAKRDAFLELVRELVAEGRRALVFSQFVELLQLWAKDLDREKIAYEYLDGSTVDRGAVVDRFQRGRAPLFLISLKAGGAGLNLTAADTVIHCDPWWNPAVENQATDRAHRIGQTQAVTVVRLVAQGTVEEKIGALKAKKRELAEAIVGAGGDAALRGLTEDDVRALLGDVEGDGEEPEELRLTPPPAPVAPTETEGLAARARRWLKATGETQRAFGERVGISQSLVSRLVRGEPLVLSEATAERIRDLCD